MLAQVSLLLRLSSPSMHLLVTGIAHLTTSMWSTLLLVSGDLERQRYHEQLCDPTNHDCPSCANPCSALRLLLATIASWAVIPGSLVLNALYWTCCLDQAKQKGEASVMNRHRYPKQWRRLAMECK